MFAELANDQTVMVFDLGGGTLDLSLVKYNKQQVTVVASGGNLHLGGIDWNAAIEKWACEQIVAETPNEDPRLDRHSMQALANDVETGQAGPQRPTAGDRHHPACRPAEVVRDRSPQLRNAHASPLDSRAREITEQLLRTHKLQIEGPGLQTRRLGPRQMPSS